MIIAAIRPALQARALRAEIFIASGTMAGITSSLADAGHDRYDFTCSLGGASVLDADGSGGLWVDGVPLTGGKLLKKPMSSELTRSPVSRMQRAARSEVLQ